MSELRRIGYSDRVFFHKTERNLRIRVVLKQKLDLAKLKDAAAKALEEFEEYRVTPVRVNGELYYEPNTKEVPFFPYDDIERYFGTDEVNGYLFYILYEDNAFMLSLFHGLTDFKGMWALLLSIIYHYAVNTGLGVPDIRITDAPDNDQDRYDPYSLYEDGTCGFTMPKTTNVTFFIPCEKYPDGLHRQHEYTLSLSASKFLAMTHEWNTSASCALAAIISNTLANLYGAGDKDIVLKVTCDMRPTFNSHSKVNMSEAVLLVSDKDLRDKPLSEHCAALRSMMKSQFTRENFSRTMAASIDATKVKEGKKAAADITVPQPKLTYVLTYPGKMDLPEEYQDLVADFELKGYFPIESVRFSIKTTGDELRIGIDQMFDGDKIIRAIAKSFGNLGFEISVKDEGMFGGDRYSPDLLREIKT